jgi:hypothetical protein
MYAGKTSLTKIHSELPGFSINGWLMLLVALGLLISGLYCFRTALNPVGIYPDWVSPGSMGTAAAFLFALGAVIWRGLTIIQPNESILILLFGAYHGTIRRSGFRWCNPFARRVKIALRARNLVSDQLKVNDNHGNPIEISVVVWRIADTAQALFDRCFGDNKPKPLSVPAKRLFKALLAWWKWRSMSCKDAESSTLTQNAARR